MTGQGHAPGLVLWVRRRVINVATDLAVTFSDEEEHVQVRRRETKGGASYLLCRECVVACAVAVYSSTIYLNSHTVSSSSSSSYPWRQEELKFTKVPLDLLHVGMPPGVHIWFKYENRDNPEKEVYLDEASIRKKIRGYVCICLYYE